MTQPDTLHTRLRAELDRRQELAKAALCDQPWQADEEGVDNGSWIGTHWTVWTTTDDTEAHIACGLTSTDAKFIALHDPADAIRRYEGELEVLERHEPGYPGGEVDYGTHTERTETGQYVEVRDAEPIPAYYCERCDDFQPCIETKGVAHRLGVNVDG